MIKDAWNAAKKHWEEDQHMNKALTECFLSMLPLEHQLEYAEIMTRDPNRRFEVTYNHYYNVFGQEDEV